MDKPLQQSWPLPKHSKPIVIIGAGGIVNDAQMPAYHKANFHVQGIFDINQEHARETADRWQIETIYPSLDQATLFTDVVYDLPIPPVVLLCLTS